MDPHDDRPSRRELLSASTLGVGGLALAWLLHEEGLLAAPVKPDMGPRRFDLTPKRPHFPGKARAMISLFMQAGPSHVGLLDATPALAQYDGKASPRTRKYGCAPAASA